jgi:DNA-binding CsgD family transcriptional regulator/tetratricopeptide (TPR) repeat protein
MGDTRPLGVFVSRRREMALLRAALAEARRQHGQVVLVSGEAGIGKTRLAQECAALPPAGSTMVLWGRCRQGNTSPPYWPWTQIVDACVERSSDATLRRIAGPAASRLGLLAPLVSERLRIPVAPPETTDRFQLCGAVQALLRRASLHTPLVLVLEDIHWADENSLLLLEVVAQEIRDQRVLIVGTYRTDEVRPALAQTIGELARLGVRRIGLGGLSAAETGRLMTKVSGQRPRPEVVERIFARTGGNPFFVTEIARLESADGNAIPDNVRAAIAQRLCRLSTLANELLAVASVVGREFDIGVVAAVLPDAGEESVLDAVGEVLQAALVERRPQGGDHRYHFRHELIRDAIYDGLCPGRRARWHAAILHTLERFHGPEVDNLAAELAVHASRAEPLVGSAAVVKYSRLAGDQKMSALAYEGALPHFERAWRARHPLPLDAEAARILFGMGCAQAATALRWNRQEGWASVRRAVEYYLQAGEIQRAIEAATHPAIGPESAAGVAAVVEPMLAAVPRGSKQEGWLRARLGAALYFETGSHARALAAFERAHQLAAVHGDQPLALRTLAYETSVDHFDLRWPDVLTKSRRVMKLARIDDDLHSETYARYRAAFVLTHIGDAANARLEVEANLAAAERLRDRGLLADALYVACLLAQLTGAWEEARAHSNRGLTLAPQHLPLLHARVLLEYETGHDNAGRDHLRQLLEVDRRAGPYPLAGVFTAITLAQTEAWSRDGAGATAALAAVRAVLERPVPVANAVLTARVARALVCLRAARVAECEAELECLSPVARVIPTQWCLVNERLAGRLARAAGQPRTALARFESALGFCRRSGYRPELARTCYDYANALLESDGRKDRAKAAALIEEAEQVAGQLDMGPLAAPIARFRSRYRIRLQRKPGGLSTRELEVLRLIAAGKANKEIAAILAISMNTVANHVARVLAKTGASNRTGAAAYAAQHHLFEPTAAAR